MSGIDLVLTIFLVQMQLIHDTDPSPLPPLSRATSYTISVNVSVCVCARFDSSHSLVRVCTLVSTLGKPSRLHWNVLSCHFLSAMLE